MNYSVTTSERIEQIVCSKIERIRLSRNITQKQLALEAGVSLRTIRRLEKGEGVSLDTFIRVLMALDLQGHFGHFLPDPTIRPMDRVQLRGKERQRARPVKVEEPEAKWSWGDEGND